jgi:predicted methyltransferase
MQAVRRIERTPTPRVGPVGENTAGVLTIGGNLKAALLLFAASTFTLASCAQAPHAPPSDAIRAAVASPDRPAADAQRDEARKPAELLAFAGVKPGDRVAELIPGGGYYTRIFSNAVGPTGHVYAVVPAEFVKLAPKALASAQAIPTPTAFTNVTVVSEPFATLHMPEPVDVAWTSDNYHDVYGFVGADAAAQMDAAVFKALKPGGVFVVVDHVANAGTSSISSHTLHRIDPETVKQQALAAGFKLEAESSVLRNPDDKHDMAVFAPALRGHTDQFALKFRKPG